MPATTFTFEELDDPTREYLTAARDGRGAGMPGAFASADGSGNGCLAGVGLLVVIATLMLTLTDWLGVVYEDPARVALIQTAGLVLGGWMVVWAMRTPLRRQNPASAGWWVYADPERVYRADGARVAVSPMADVREVNGNHQFGEKGEYKSSTVTLEGEGPARTLTLYDQTAAENLVGFLGYVLYHRNQDADARPELTPTQLGAVAAFAGRTGGEPVDAEGRLDPGLLPPVREVPETPPEKVRPAAPSVLPYVLILLAGVGCFFAMQEVNIVRRDDAVFEAVTAPPVEPRYLRSYLADPRNTAHRDAVTKRLAGFYAPAVNALKQAGAGQPLRDGLAKALDGVKTAEQPILSIRVTETDTPAGQEAGKAARLAKVREKLSLGITQYLTAKTPAIVVPAGMVINPPPAPVGDQLVAFVEAPEDAPAAHIEIRYKFVPSADGKFLVSGRVEVRGDVADPPAGVDEVTVAEPYAADMLLAGVEQIANVVVKQMTE